jgi:stalled ribosome rescue protein Dom34
LNLKQSFFIGSRSGILERKQGDRIMALVAIWVDQQHAKLYHYTQSGIVKEEFQDRHVDHHSHGSDQKDHQRLEAKLFKQFTSHLTKAEQILILGPGMAKNHLKNYLESHDPHCAKKIVGLESMDHASDAQVEKFASKYFNTEKLK